MKKVFFQILFLILLLPLVSSVKMKLWNKIKFYFGICYCGGKIKRWSNTKAYCNKCNKTWEVNGL